MVHVGTHTLKHESGYNNFVQRGKPLGWDIGSDSEEISIGLNALYNNKLIDTESDNIILHLPIHTSEVYDEDDFQENQKSLILRSFYFPLVDIIR